MNQDRLKAIGLMLGAGLIMGIMFNIAMVGDPFNLGGMLGGLLTGLLMYILS